MKSLSGQPSPTRDAEAPALRREGGGSSAQSPVVSRSATAFCCLKPRRGDMSVAPGPPHPLPFCFSPARGHPRPKVAQAFLPTRGQTARAAPPKNKGGNPGTGAFYKPAAPLGLAAGCASALPKTSRPAVWPSGFRCDSGAGFGNKFSPETFAFDADGNLVQDGRWSYVWDLAREIGRCEGTWGQALPVEWQGGRVTGRFISRAEKNRLISMQSVSSVPSAAKLKLDFAYDQLSRRTQKVVSTWNGSAYVPQSTNRFVYDGWNLAVRLTSDLGPLESFTWGTDLSGSLQGAGGVGGLLSVTVHTGPNPGAYFCCYDGNGNVMGLINAADGSVAARYEYDPFGELLRATGPLAEANPFRFSTQYTDDETDLVCYLHRYYNPSTGNWPNRDPLGEPGFELLRGKQASASAGEPNRYLFVKNSPLQNIDPDGLDLITITYTNGTSVTYGTFSSPNMGQLMGALTNAAGSISGITIKGHACCTIQSFGDDLITMDSTGTKILGTDGTDITGALKSALAPGAWIYLAGCGSGRGAGNIAQQMSTVLPGVTVFGHQGVAALNVPFCGCAIGKRNYYINGTLQHSAW